MKFKGLMMSALLFVASAAQAADVMKPFVLASKAAGTVAETSTQVKGKLTAAGFTVVGEYAPYAGANIIIVTNDALKQNAAASDAGAYGAAQRISVTEANKEIQVGYTNPTYMAKVYRMKGDLAGVSAALGTALGKVEEFGAKGLTAKELGKYHYMMGMPYFDEPIELAEYGSYQEAVQAVDSRLTSNANGLKKVYRVDVPGKEESVFGVAMKGGASNPLADDKFIMSTIDFRELKSTAHLPYEVVVKGKKVYALQAEFRIAINFPDLSMMGDNSFMKIRKCPDLIKDVLKKTVAK
jgi:hypothetical protein